LVGPINYRNAKSGLTKNVTKKFISKNPEDVNEQPERVMFQFAESVSDLSR
jgi:hypothetical protein